MVADELNAHLVGCGVQISDLLCSDSHYRETLIKSFVLCLALSVDTLPFDCIVLYINNTIQWYCITVSVFSHKKINV